MALNLLTSHPVFTQTPPFLLPFLHPPPPSPTSIRLSRWNNPNFDSSSPSLRRRRRLADIESDLRRHRRFSSALSLSSPPNPQPSNPNPTLHFKSHGSPSTPSAPSLPGRRSKYSKPPQNPNSNLKPNPKNHNPSHPAFRRIAAPRPRPAPAPAPDSNGTDSGIRITENGVTYRLDGAPFEFQYSYTETPKVRPLALREPPFVPFGPEDTPRPWTGRKPLPKSKKELPEFDSFKLPPPGKKGVKPVQAPGPFRAGAEPTYRATSPEEVLGEPLTKEEVAELVKGSLRTRRQLNMGRDGLTHNMLENIHAHWKRRRVCKIKCKGVCTVDLDNVCRQLEEKVGGKVIFRRGGVIFLFRGRNYNYRTRPRFPLMLWKPVTPVYPRLVQRAPEGLTLEEATEMRKRGRELPPICKLGKNGVYSNLVQQVREAFEACDLVRVNCRDLHKSDCRKIGAKLKDLVPCVLVSFEYEHILMWRGKDWKSLLPSIEENLVESVNDQATSIGNDHVWSDQVLDSDTEQSNTEIPTESNSLDEGTEKPKESTKQDIESDLLSIPTTAVVRSSSFLGTIHNEPLAAIQKELSVSNAENDLEDTPSTLPCKSISPYEGENSALGENPSHQVTGVELSAANSDLVGDLEITDGMDLEIESRESFESDGTGKSSSSYMEGVMLLLKEAVGSGNALVLGDESMDADVVYQKSVALASTAPPGPVFQHKVRKASVRRNKGERHVELFDQDIEVEVSSSTLSDRKSSSKKRPQSWKKDDAGEFLSDVIPHGSLRVDELAKLLS